MAAVAEQYIKDHVATLKAGALAESLIRRTIVKVWGRRPVASITTKDIAELVGMIAEAEPHKAAKTLNHCRNLFQWCMAPSRGYLDKNPVAAMTAKRDFGITGKPRQVALSHDAIQAIWSGAGELPLPGCPFIRFLLLTGQRRGEVAGAQWSEFDLDGERVWNIPASRMKAGRAHEVPLTGQMIELLRAVPVQGPFVFSIDGHKPYKSFFFIKQRLDKLLADLPDWTIHDIRRAVRTGLGAIPSIPHDIRELVIAHMPPALVQTYDLHDYRAEKRQALTLWGERLMRIVALNSGPAGNVTPLRAAR